MIKPKTARKRKQDHLGRMRALAWAPRLEHALEGVAKRLDALRRRAAKVPSVADPLAAAAEAVGSARARAADLGADFQPPARGELPPGTEVTIRKRWRADHPCGERVLRVLEVRGSGPLQMVLVDCGGGEPPLYVSRAHLVLAHPA